jgi:hypothetical protein
MSGVRSGEPDFSQAFWYSACLADSAATGLGSDILGQLQRGALHELGSM